MTPSFPTRRSSDLEACSYSISCVVPATAGRRQLQAVSLRHHLDGMADPFGNLAGAGKLHALLEVRSGERTFADHIIRVVLRHRPRGGPAHLYRRVHKYGRGPGRQKVCQEGLVAGVGDYK